MTESREDLVYMAKICEQTERFDDMLEYMKRILGYKEELSTEERNLLSVAYKNCVSPKRTAWRIIENQEKKENAKQSNAEQQLHLKLITQQKAKIEKELEQLCNEIITKIDEILLPKAGTPESKVFYLKMKADYFRYISEYNNGTNKEEIINKASSAYQDATKIASDLDTTDPIRLGLALNYSVFFYEIKNDPKTACQMAKTAFDEAIVDIEGIKDSNYKDSTTIMQLMRDNLTLWTQELDDQGEEGEED